MNNIKGCEKEIIVSFSFAISFLFIKWFEERVMKAALIRYKVRNGALLYNRILVH